MTSALRGPSSASASRSTGLSGANTFSVKKTRNCQVAWMVR